LAAGWRRLGPQQGPRASAVSARCLSFCPKYAPSKHSIMHDLQPKPKLKLTDILTYRGHQDLIKFTTTSIVINGLPVSAKDAMRYKQSQEASICLDGAAVEPVPLLAVFHKPVSVQCTTRDPQDRESLKELIPKWPFLASMHPVVSSNN
jgi:hypothetical protein